MKLRNIFQWLWHLIFPATIQVQVLPTKTEETNKEDNMKINDTNPLVPMPDFKRMFFEVIRDNEDKIREAERDALIDPDFPEFCKIAFRCMLETVLGLRPDFFMDHDYKGPRNKWQPFCFCFLKICKDIGISAKYKGDNAFYFEPNSVRQLMKNPPPDIDNDFRLLLTQGGPYR